MGELGPHVLPRREMLTFDGQSTSWVGTVPQRKVGWCYQNKRKEMWDKGGKNPLEIRFYRTQMPRLESFKRIIQDKFILKYILKISEKDRQQPTDSTNTSLPCNIWIRKHSLFLRRQNIFTHNYHLVRQIVMDFWVVEYGSAMSWESLPLQCAQWTECIMAEWLLCWQ